MAPPSPLMAPLPKVSRAPLRLCPYAWPIFKGLTFRHRCFLYHHFHFIDDTIGYRAPLLVFYCPAYIVKLLLDFGL